MSLIISLQDACYQYWPTQGYQAYKNLSVKLEGQEKQATTAVACLILFYCTFTTIIAVVEEVIKVQRRTGNNPIVVHCRHHCSSILLVVSVTLSAGQGCSVPYRLRV